MNQQNNTRRSNISNMNVLHILGGMLTNNTLIETIYDPETGAAKLVVCKENEEIQKLPEYTSAGDIYRPLIDPNVKSGRVLLTRYYDLEIDRMELFHEIQRHINIHVEMDPRDVSVAARYIMMTWVYDRFQQIPYLRIMGTWGTGKSRFLQVVGGLCYHRSLLGEGVTEANIYRWIDKYPGTLVLDEADFTNTSNGLLVQILNGGYGRDGSVMRNELIGGRYTPIPFSSFGPKILAAHKPYENGGLESRFLTLFSEKMTRSDIPSVIPPALYWDEAINLRNRLLGFRYKYFFQIHPADQVSGLENVEPRLAEIIKPLLQILGESELTEEVKSFVAQESEERINNLASGDDGLVAEAVLELWPTDGRRRPYVREIAERVNARRKYDYPLNDRKIGHLLREIGLKTERTANGYRVVAKNAQLVNLSRRYGIEWPKGEN